MSRTTTLAPMPAAIFAELIPTTPPPRITTFAGATPGTPPRRTPRPPYNFSRYLAPSCTAMRPATSDIGVSNGSSRVGSSTVSYATQVAPLSICARVSFSSAAKWKYVKTNWPERMCCHSRSIGSFTFMIISLSRQTAAASGAILAPTAVNTSSEKPLPNPAPVSTRTECPAAISASAPAGTSAIRFSFVLISFGTPIFIVRKSGGEELAVTLLRWKLIGPTSFCALRAETHDGHARRIEVDARHPRNVIDGNGVDEREDFVERAKGFVVQLHGRGAVHPRRDAFQRQRNLSLELLSAHRDFVGREAVVDDRLKLGADRIERGAGRFGSSRDVHAVHTAVGVKRLVGVHRIRQAQILAYPLKEPRAHTAAEEHAHQQQRESLGIAVRNCLRSQDDVRLRPVSRDVQRLRCSGVRGRRRHGRRIARVQVGPTSVRQNIQQPVVLDVSCGGNDQPSRVIGSTVQVANLSNAERVDRVARAEN